MKEAGKEKETLTLPFDHQINPRLRLPPPRPRPPDPSFEHRHLRRRSRPSLRRVAAGSWAARTTAARMKRVLPYLDWRNEVDALRAVLLLLLMLPALLLRR